jgi:hypothetical protein
MLASEEAARVVYAQMLMVASQRLQNLLAQPPSAGPLADLYGGIYESAALAALRAGGRFSLLDNTTGHESALVLPAVTKEHRFSSVQDLAALVSQHGKGSLTMYRPYSATFAAVDAIIQGGRMANVTINTQHDVKLRGRGNLASQGLLPTALAMGVPESDDLPLYFVVPEERYLELVAQRTRAALPLTFPIIWPEEQRMRSRLRVLLGLRNGGPAKKGKGTIAMSPLGSVGRGAAATRKMTAPEIAELQQLEADIATQAPLWESLKQRIKYFILCINFAIPKPQAAPAV